MLVSSLPRVMAILILLELPVNTPAVASGLALSGLELYLSRFSGQRVTVAETRSRGSADGSYQEQDFACFWL